MSAVVSAFWTGVLAGYGIAIPVGAIAILIVETAMRSGFRCGFAAGAGTATADLVYSSLAVIGGAGLASAIEGHDQRLRMASGLVLMAIAVLGLLRIRNGRPGRTFSAASGRDIAVIYVRFLGLTIVNPTTVVYFAAVVIGLGLANDIGAGEGLVFVLGAVLASLSLQTVLAVLGATAGRRLPAGAQTAAVIGGNLIVLAVGFSILLG